ncbi:hypothetical protein [Catenulispora rubra]|uniref:hypothetical protein n=1 Tax=Catenulispora rubra TaxID=280293 RepID=UPI001E39A9E3|nr:hypothetical protein [Catenulispora rubra]
MTENAVSKRTTTPSSGEAGQAPVLEHAARHVLKATHVPLTPAVTGTQDGVSTESAVVKLAYVRQLGLQPGDIDRIQERFRAKVAASADSTARGPELADHPVMGLLRQFEQLPVPGLAPRPAAFAGMPMAALTAVGRALVRVRTEALTSPMPVSSPAAGNAAALLNRAVNAGVWLAAHANPIGMLNLERLEMAPAGIEHGELIATIPLAPGEQTSVTEKEWSVRTKEFTSIVTDSLENVSETGVTDNTELAQAVTSQSQHANQFNITGTVSGGIAVVSGSVTAGFSDQSSQSASATDSRKHAQAMTQKASSRSRTEHKVTISTTTVAGTSETTTRTLSNPGADPIRIDYFSLLRKWQVRLYRYGLRLTYDIVVPEPGAALRRAYQELDDLKRQLGPFEFKVPHSEIVDEVVAADPQPGAPFAPEPHYKILAERYGAKVDDPPRQQLPFAVSQTVTGLDEGRDHVHDFQLTVNVPTGQAVDTLAFSGMVTGPATLSFDMTIVGTTLSVGNQQNTYFRPAVLIDAGTNAPFLQGAVGQQQIGFYFQQANSAQLQVLVATKPSPEAIETWRTQTWNAIYDAAQTQYYAQQQDIAARVAELEAMLTAVDTLTLRREESDEVMKTVLRFLLGTDFAFMPGDVAAAFAQVGADLKHGIESDGNALGMDHAQWSTVMQHEDVVKFINQAIEWENVVTYLYSYFWDVPESWEFIRQIRHPDPNRQAFLRAGSARVVLTVRKGWEEAWVRYVEGGFDGAVVNDNHPYLTIAQEIAAYDDRNYPGIPPANLAQNSPRTEDATVTTCATALSPSTQPVTIEVADTRGFVVGRDVVIDLAGDPNHQEAQRLIAVPDATHLTLAGLLHDHDGTTTPIPVIQPGEKGTLIAEWHEYTPTSGTDIKMTSNLTQIS